MDDQAKERIRIRCKESLHQNETLRNLLPGLGPDTLRADFARCAIDLALEHHSAIVGLVLHGHYGSAAALLRPLLEAGIIGAWLMYVAPCKEGVHKLAAAYRDGTDSEIPSISKMSKKISEVSPQFLPLQNLFVKGGSAIILHKYTHGDVEQMSRRGRADGWLENEILLHLILADAVMAASASLGTVIYDARHLAEYVFPRRDALGEELVRMGLASSIEPQPNHLPKPLSDGCGSASGC